MKTNTDDSAFPIVIDDVSKNQYVHILISKREHFASLAMQGLLAGGSDGSMPEFARLAVEAADNLIEELNK